ncbi:MAG: TatD family hydrolase [Acidobacteria bacterium]|jgi:TatD DNase family protein|nr:TatD family hydrolase [Acidobacteriota bacterium]
MGHAGYIDFHCHLDDPCFDGERWRIIDQCFSSGFSSLVTVADAYDENSLARTAEILDYHGAMAAVAGAHPHGADGYGPAVEKQLLAFLDRRPVLALGEVGLDFHYDLAKRENQEAAFRRQVAIARERALPLVIHSRQAEARVLEILNLERFAAPVVFHCYTGDAADAAEICARGYFLSFSGIITFKKAEALRAIVAATPLDRLLSETDSPYLAPEPERGRTNTPLAVMRVAQKIAEIKNTDISVLLTGIAGNFQRLRP